MKDIRRLLIKLALLVLPLFSLAIFYLFSDPFKVIYRYESFYQSGSPSSVTLNRDYVSVETFLRHQEKYQWDSFIFGNSRSIFYQVRDWGPYIDSSRVFHFDASGESIYGIERKLAFLEERTVPIRNALIILDRETLKTVQNSRGHLYRKHPLLSGQGRISFQMEFMKTFFSGPFVFAYLDFRLSNKIKPYMTESFLLDNRPRDYDLGNNEIQFGFFERQIETAAEAYYGPRKALFYKRGSVQKVALPIIYTPQENLLIRIHSILTKKKTNYRVVISPLYHQERFNPDDLAYLRQLFGHDKVFDFSGINDITQDYHNYYDNSHYRPHIARFILSKIYDPTQ